MDGKTFIWSLRSGGKIGQMSREQKLQEGYAYIQRLQDDGENILHIEELADKIIIHLEDK